MATRTPSYRLVVDGTDITPTVNARLVDLQLEETRGEEADQLSLTLSDHDGALQIPRKGVSIALALGYRESGLVDKGTFTVDEAEHSGTPDVITIRARSADLSQSLRNRREQSWHGTILGTLLQTMALRNGLRLRVATTLAQRAVPHMDQSNESDLNFLTRLGRLHDAVATIKAGHLLFLPIGQATNSQGQGLPTFTITRADGDRHRYSQADRDQYTGVRAYWHSAHMGNRRSVLVGSAVNARVLKDTHPNEATALQAAQGEWNRIQRGSATLSLTLAHGEPLVTPETPVVVRGFKAQIDGTGWLVSRAVHGMDGSGGYLTEVELEVSLDHSIVSNQ
ncbi:phage late control D family protein [Hydrogenophaga sp.]|uniref:phage late control D family protein n=1 Tax=Hydrogenophaga sp. TaxID=1904254 RepID=UPI003F6EFE70